MYFIYTYINESIFTGMTQQGRDRKKRVCQKLWHEETTTVLQLCNGFPGGCYLVLEINATVDCTCASNGCDPFHKSLFYIHRVARSWFTNSTTGSLSCSWLSWLAL